MEISFRYIMSLSKFDHINGNQAADSETKDSESTLSLKDPLPDELRAVIKNRMRSDIAISVVILLLFFALHCTSVFTAAQPSLQVRLERLT